MSREAEIAWAAGVFEGEGTIPSSRRLVVKMTDEDVIMRLWSTLGGTVNGPYQPTEPKRDGSPRKQFWIWQVGGDDACYVAHMIEPWLGDRRRIRLAESDLLDLRRLPPEQFAARLRVWDQTVRSQRPERRMLKTS